MIDIDEICEVARATTSTAALVYMLAEDRPELDRAEVAVALGCSVSAVARAREKLAAAGYISLRQPKVGFVYAVTFGGCSLTKIGWTGRSPRDRFQEVGAGLGPVQAHAWVCGSQALERELHERFAQHRRHGEWFDVSVEAVAAAFGEVFEAAAGGTA